MLVAAVVAMCNMFIPPVLIAPIDTLGELIAYYVISYGAIAIVERALLNNPRYRRSWLMREVGKKA